MKKNIARRPTVQVTYEKLTVLLKNDERNLFKLMSLHSVEKGQLFRLLNSRRSATVDLSVCPFPVVQELFLVICEKLTDRQETNNAPK